MKIAFIVNQFPAISETFVLRQLTGLLDRGHQVDIFASSAGGDPIRHRDVEKYSLLSRTYYLTDCACSDPAAVRMFKRARLLFTKFHKHPAAILKSLDVARYGKGALLLQVLCQVSPFLDKGPYDIVHCQFGDLGPLGLLLKDTEVFTGKLITSFRGYDASSNLRSHGSAFYDELFARGDLFLCVSEHLKKKLVRLGCPLHKILVHRSGVDTTDYPAGQSVAARSGPVRVVTVGRLNEKKGIEYGIRAIAQMLRNAASIEYVIAGDGPLKKNLQALIDELGVGHSVRLVGWKSQEQVRELLNNSDILLAPSITSEQGDEEGIPGVIMEAFAQGLPVVSTWHAGIPEVVKDGESGYLVPERDPGALAEKVHALLEDPGLRQSMGRQGRDVAQTYYAIGSLNDRLVEVYENALNGDTGRSVNDFEGSVSQSSYAAVVNSAEQSSR